MLFNGVFNIFNYDEGENDNLVKYVINDKLACSADTDIYNEIDEFPGSDNDGMLNSSEDINNGLTRKRKLSMEDNNYEVIDMDISGVSDSNLEESQTELDEVTPMIKKKYLRCKTPGSKVIRDKGWHPVLDECNTPRLAIRVAN